MQHIGFVVFIVALAVGVATANEHISVEPQFGISSSARYEIDGPVGSYVQAVVNNWMLRVPRSNPAILEMFADRDQPPYRDLLPWSGEFAGKYLTCLVQMLALTEDQRLKKLGSNFVEKLVSLQAEDGYLGPFSKECRLTGKNTSGGQTWDAWGHYHVMMGLILWHDRTNDANALKCASQIADLICKKYLEAGQPLSVMRSCEMNQAVVHSLALLYQRTGESKYLEQAHEIVQDFAAHNAGNYLNAGLEKKEFYEIPKPRWESLHPLMGLAELYWVTGNEDYRKVFEHYWWSIVKLDRHNNGGFSSGERAHGDPYHPGPIETCCTVAWMAMSVEMLKMTGDSRVADELEHSTLNQAIAMHSPTGKWSTYNTPMEGRRVPSTVDIAFQVRPGSEELNCCSVNAARTLGMISDWALMRDDEGLVLNWYGSAKMEDQVHQIPVKITQETEYPREGLVKINVDPEEPLTFALKLRIPHWSAKTSVTINDKAVTADPGTYLVLDREWKPGDQIVVEFDFSLRFWAGERAYEGKVSVYRGPLLMAYEENAPASLKFSEHWNAYGHFRAAEHKDASVIFSFHGDSIEWHGFYMDDAGKARVIIDGKEVAIVDQYGPQRDVPFLWKRDGLGPGKHLAQIEVLGEKHPDSSNVWVNIQDVKSSVDIPTLDAARISKEHSIKSVNPGFFVMRIEGPNGYPVQLRDYASAGLKGNSYFTWLPVQGVPSQPFSPINPSRTTRLTTY